MSDTWPNGVPYIDEYTRRENLRDPEALRALIVTFWIHTGRRVEEQLTTEQKELLADVVQLAPPKTTFDRWWRQ